MNINESKQVGILYHVCNAESMLYNLENNSITPGANSNSRKSTRPKSKGQPEYAVSFTRNSDYFVDTVEEPVFFQIVIDGDSLSNSKKIYPFAADDYQDPGSFESEEVIYFKQGEGLYPLTNYIIKVNIIVASVSRLVYMSYSELTSIIDAVYETVKRIPRVEVVNKDSHETLPVKKIMPFINLLLVLFNYRNKVNGIDFRGFLSKYGTLSGSFRNYRITAKESIPISKYREFFSIVIDAIDEIYRSKAKYYLYNQDNDRKLVTSDASRLLLEINNYLENPEYKLKYIVIDAGKDISQFSKPNMEIIFNHNDEMESISINAMPVL